MDFLQAMKNQFLTFQVIDAFKTKIQLLENKKNITEDIINGDFAEDDDCNSMQAIHPKYYTQERKLVSGC